MWIIQLPIFLFKFDWSVQEFQTKFPPTHKLFLNFELYLWWSAISKNNVTSEAWNYGLTNDDAKTYFATSMDILVMKIYKPPTTKTTKNKTKQRKQNKTKNKLHKKKSDNKSDNKLMNLGGEKTFSRINKVNWSFNFKLTLAMCGLSLVKRKTKP